MVESIATASLLGHRPISGRFFLKDNFINLTSVNVFQIPFKDYMGRKVLISSKRRINRSSVSSTKAQAMELTKRAYSFEEVDRIPKRAYSFEEVDRIPRDFGYRIRTSVDQKPSLWAPENKADNPSLHNPLLRQERMGCGWLGAIFEWEGVLIEDNPDIEKQAWLALSQEEGKSPPPTFTLRRIGGMKNEQAISEVLCWSRDPTEVRRLASRKEDIYQALQGGVYRFRSGSREFVNALLNYNIPMALVSTRPRRILEKATGAIGVKGVFTVIVASEDVYRGKPDPEMFVYAAQLLNFIPERCIVFGNSNLTVEAAHDARMKCVAVASRHPVYELGAADRVVKRLDELSVVDLKNLAAVESDELGSSEPELEMEGQGDEESYTSSLVAVDGDVPL